ncbi:MAG: hypothetical protein KBD37_07980 [Burkholderiales bacterium]|nr:hypothetical protein [Burkholderiales bacterium]
MDVYKVGGCVRDKLLGIPVTDNDFVVVGSTPQEMAQLGFIPVGKDFPVFLHPQTREEYALARSEKKIGLGYHGFTFQTSPDISLIEDLKRRDLTINAIAEDVHGNLIDPFKGINDLNHKIIRHVSEAFIEDPLRVLRAARFSAKLDFTISPDTLELMKKIVATGELKLLSKERVWTEVHKALLTDHCENFFRIMHKVHVFKEIFPEFETFIKNLTQFTFFKTTISQINNSILDKRFALLYYSVSKNYSLKDTQQFINNAYANKSCKNLAIKLTNYYTLLKELDMLNSENILKLIIKLDPFRRTTYYNNFVDLAYIIANADNDHNTCKNVQLLEKIIAQFRQINYAEFKSDKPQEVMAKIYAYRLSIIKTLMEQQ